MPSGQKKVGGQSDRVGIFSVGSRGTEATSHLFSPFSCLPKARPWTWVCVPFFCVTANMCWVSFKPTPNNLPSQAHPVGKRLMSVVFFLFFAACAETRKGQPGLGLWRVPAPAWRCWWAVFPKNPTPKSMKPASSPDPRTSRY